MDNFYSLLNHNSNRAFLELKTQNDIDQIPSKRWSDAGLMLGEGDISRFLEVYYVSHPTEEKRWLNFGPGSHELAQRSANARYVAKHEMLAQRRFNAGPPSQTVDQH